MKFSVIVPCYNSSKTISIPLESLANQSYADFEVIVIDDASSDYYKTLSIIEEYRKRLNIIVIRNTTNKNGAYSRNQGILRSKGEMVAFLDSDDSWVQNRLELALKEIDKIKDKRYIIYARFELIGRYSTGAILPIRGIRKKELVSEYVFSAGQQMQTSTFVCPVSVAKEILFDETLSRHQDSDFMMRIQENGIKIVFQNFKCASYHFTVDNLRSRIRTGRINSQYCFNWLQKKNKYFSKKAIAGYKLLVLSRILFMEGSFIRSFEMIVASFAKIGLKNLFDIVITKINIVIKTRLGLQVKYKFFICKPNNYKRAI
jgi:glycosyltransferase involved in cell wall biosynthesis